MTIRKATSEDVPAIVDLLKVSLGESLLPKTESFWRWKHDQNPFGKSFVLLAIEKGQLVGVRAFMQWRWQRDSRIFRAVRAVDTATHPDFQGKGIFRKLTMQLVAQCAAASIDFVFNTPNKQSRPGYLKMGWRQMGRLPVRISIVNPITPLRKSVLDTEEFLMPVESYLKHYFDSSSLNCVSDGNMRTVLSKEYLQWRYADIPVNRYYVIRDDKGFAICRFKTGRIGKELRVTDFFWDHDSLPLGIALVLRIARMTKTRYVTCEGITKRFTSGIVARQGPMVTVRQLNSTDIGPLVNFVGWQPSLGDLELF